MNGIKKKTERREIGMERKERGDGERRDLGTLGTRLSLSASPFSFVPTRHSSSTSLTPHITHFKEPRSVVNKGNDKMEGEIGKVA